MHSRARDLRKKPLAADRLLLPHHPCDFAAVVDDIAQGIQAVARIVRLIVGIPGGNVPSGDVFLESEFQRRVDTAGANVVRTGRIHSEPFREL